MNVAIRNSAIRAGIQLEIPDGVRDSPLPSREQSGSTATDDNGDTSSVSSVIQGSHWILELGEHLLYFLIFVALV